MYTDTDMKVKTKNAIAKRLFGRWGKYTVYIVDDEAIRNRAQYAEEFSDYGVNIGERGLVTINFPFIPLNEIWVAKSIKLSERHFIVHEALSYVAGVDRGLSAGEAYDHALRCEQIMRTREAIHKFNLRKKNIVFKNPVHADVSRKIYRAVYATIADGAHVVTVYQVNGEVVRDIYKTDYVAGGHGYVYAWIPQNEIWIDDSIPRDEIPVIILHEFIERTLMKHKRFPYVKAHVIASKIEFQHRGHFYKKDVVRLNARAVMRLISQS